MVVQCDEQSQSLEFVGVLPSTSRVPDLAMRMPPPGTAQPSPGTFAASIDDPYGMAEPDPRTHEELLRLVRPKRPWIVTRLLAVLAFVIGLAIPLVALHDEVAEALYDLAPGIAVVVFPGFEHVGPSPIQPRPKDQKRFELAEVKPAVVADVLRKAPKDSGYD